MIDNFSINQPINAPISDYKLWEKAGHKTIMRLDPHDRTAGPMPFYGFLSAQNGIAAQGAGNSFASNQTVEPAISKTNGYSNTTSDFEFNDVLDMINPLQHVPIIGTIYRSLTGDVLKPMSNIIGGAIFGGPVGVVSSTINVIVKDRTGKDLAENALSIVGLGPNIDKPQKPDILFETATNRYDDAKKNFSRGKIQDLNWNA